MVSSMIACYVFFFKQKTAYEMRISDWSSDVCSSDLDALAQWYGPTGLAIENHEADIREGGVWRFDMVGVLEGQQQRFPSLMRFLKVVPNETGEAQIGRAHV